MPVQSAGRILALTGSDSRSLFALALLAIALGTLAVRLAGSPAAAVGTAEHARPTR